VRRDRAGITGDEAQRLTLPALLEAGEHAARATQSDRRHQRTFVAWGSGWPLIQSAKGATCAPVWKRA
jgi:hypothetical protein